MLFACLVLVVVVSVADSMWFGCKYEEINPKEE
jgi:hypothetical protein